MKNQYFGDVNDYRKYGLLRALQAPGDLSLLVGWMLTPDDGSTDGQFRSYLQEQNAFSWGPRDPILYDHLSSALAGNQTPSVSLIEQSGILPRADFFSEIVPDDREGRRVWSHRLLRASSGVDLVFLDPDNGFQVRSKPIGRKDSSKYVAWHEVEGVWKQGSSLLVYQHFCRERRDLFIARLAGELSRRTGAPFVKAFETPKVLFLLAAQERHQAVFEEAIAHHLPRWRGQVDVVELSAE